MKIPNELELPAANWPSAADLVNQGAQFLSEHRTDESKKDVTMEIAGDLAGFMANTGTQAWRIRTMVLDAVSQEPRESLSKEEISKLARYVKSIYEILATIGVIICDRTGESFDYGYPEKVVSAEPKEGISQPLVVRTFRPRIMWHDRIAQQGEVDIATPMSK